MTQPMFVGKFEVRLDSKNRLSVPLALRQAGAEGGQLWSQFYLTLGAEGCIFVYTPSAWKALMEEMGATKPLADENLRTVQRLVAANVEVRKCDSEGRIVLGEGLLAHAGIEHEALWIGAVSRVEIWQKERWLAFQAASVPRLGRTIDVVSRAGLALPHRGDPVPEGNRF